MRYVVSTNLTVDQATKKLEEIIGNFQFGILHMHNIKGTLNGKGLPFEPECRVFEVCNPHKAKGVLSRDIGLNMVLPCRISIWEEEDGVKIGMLEPGKMLAALSDDPELRKIADEVEVALREVIDSIR